MIKRNAAIITIPFSPLSTANNPVSQLYTFFSVQLAGVSDGIRASTRTAPNLLPSCEQPLLSTSSSSHLWDNMNALTRYGNDGRYLQINMQATGSYAVTAMPIVRGGELEAGGIKLKCGRLNTLPPRTMLDINRLAGAVNLRDLSPDQPIQLTHFHQAWRVRAGQRVNVIVSGGGFNANAEGQALNSAAVAQNMRVCTVSGQVVGDIVDTDGDILVNL